MARDYPVHHRDAYDRAYEHTPRVLAIQRARNAAHYAMVKKYGAAMLKGHDIDHVHPLAAGGSNKPSNWRLRDPAANRGDKEVFHEKGYKPVHVPKG
jgi:hypothetical protein